MSRRISRDEALTRLDAEGCAMCRLADARFDADDVMAADEHAVLRLDRYGATHGHLLAVLRDHETRVEAQIGRAHV